MKRITRDDTEHGVEYYRANEVDSLLTDQPAQQEPDNSDDLTIAYMAGVQRGKELAQRTWVWLTDEQKQIIKFAHSKMGMMIISYDLDAMLEDIEAKLKELNT